MKPIKVSDEHHKKFKEAAKESGGTLKDFAEAMIDFTVGKFWSGELSLAAPSIEEVPKPQAEEDGA